MSRSEDIYRMLDRAKLDVGFLMNGHYSMSTIVTKIRVKLATDFEEYVNQVEADALERGRIEALKDRESSDGK